MEVWIRSLFFNKHTNKLTSSRYELTSPLPYGPVRSTAVSVQMEPTEKQSDKLWAV